MGVWWSAIVAAAGVTGAVALAGGALARWREERAGLVYELRPRYAGVVARGLAAAAVGVAALSVPLAWAGGPDRPSTPAASRLLAVDRATPAPSSAASRPAPSPTAPSPAPRTAALAAVPTPAAGGRLYHGTLPGDTTPVTVWLPAQYPGHGGLRLQTLLVRAPAAALPQVWQGLAAAVSAGHSNAFVAVAPDDPCAAASATASAAEDRLRAALSRRFTVDPHPRAWAQLALGAPGGSCAVGAEIAAPARYAGTAALSAPLPGLTDLRPDPQVRLLLAAARRDTVAQADGRRLHTALTSGVRLSFVVRDLTPDLERARLVRLAANYLTEQFAAAAAQTRSRAQ